MTTYFYPNESELWWSILIVLYPYLTGLVAGAFILASLVNVFGVKEVQPVYRMALLTALAFLIAAPLPLLAHLGQPQRAYEVLVTSNPKSAMAMLGFVYLWYLMAVLLVEIWFDYRSDMVVWMDKTTGIKRFMYRVLTMGATHLSDETRMIDHKISRVISIIGIPSAFVLHGYVGFIFGSVKANPWWSSPLMPVIFVFSAMVSGIALCLLLYWGYNKVAGKVADTKCMDTIGRYMLYAFIIDFALESLDLIHRMYEADESFPMLRLLMDSKLYVSEFIIQFLLGTLVPIALIAMLQVYKPKNERQHRFILITASVLALIGIFAMRWNVVIGGQMFSKSFRGFTIFKLHLIGGEGIVVAILIFLLPFGILAALSYFLPPFGDPIPKTETDPKK